MRAQRGDDGPSLLLSSLVPQVVLWTLTHSVLMVLMMQSVA
jgi:hypothetical protein